MADAKDRPVKTPGEDHPIHISDFTLPVDVIAGDTALAQRAHALELVEAGHDAVLYVDPGHVARERLIPSDKTSWCPYKGEASYFHIMLDGGGRLDDAVWCYREPHAAVEAIRDHLAFTDRVNVRRVASL